MSNGAVACEGHRMCQAFTSSASGIFWDFKATLCNFSKTPCFRRQCFGYYGVNMIHLSNCQPSVRCFPGCVQRFTTLQPQKCGREDLPLEVWLQVACVVDSRHVFRIARGIVVGNDLILYSYNRWEHNVFLRAKAQKLKSRCQILIKPWKVVPDRLLSCGNKGLIGG